MQKYACYPLSQPRGHAVDAEGLHGKSGATYIYMRSYSKRDIMSAIPNLDYWCCTLQLNMRIQQVGHKDPDTIQKQ